MILWSNTLADAVQVDLYNHLQKLRPNDKAANLTRIQQAIIPELLTTIVDDINKFLPKGLIYFQSKVDRQTGKTVAYTAAPLDNFRQWVQPLRTTPVDSNSHIHLHDNGDVISYIVDNEFITTSYLRFLPKGPDPAIIHHIQEKAITVADDAALMNLIDASSQPVGYLFAAMYGVKIHTKPPEGAPRPSMNRRPLPLDRILLGQTPANVKAAMAKF